MHTSRSAIHGGRHCDGSRAAASLARRLPRPQKRTSRAVLAGSLAIATATGGILYAQTAGAAVTDAVPSFPDNIIVFPDRDFVSVEGYAAHAGETASVEVNRPGVGLIGSAKALVDGGGVAFEINHPGGSCWGAGTGLNVTPDIQAGDKVTVTFPDGTGGTTTTSSAHASNAVLEPDGVTVHVAVTLGSDVNPAQVEQRIVEPALLPFIGRRDARAVPGGLTAAAKGGYSSTLDPVAGGPSGAYLATYVFTDPAAATIAANPALGERAMSWQVEDAAANRQGLTIAEFGEAGGPGMGGCPAGPASSTPAAGSAIVTRPAGATSATVKWTAADSVPTASPVTSYSVIAVNQAAVAGRQAMLGAQYPAGVTSGIVDGLDPAATYDFQVRAITADGKTSTPFTIGTGAGTADPGVPPALTLTPAAGAKPTDVVSTNKLTATTSAGSTIWYTVEGTTPNPVVAGGSIVDAALPFPAGGLTIDKKMTVHVAALNAQNLVEVVSGTFQPGAASTAKPIAPVVNVTGGQTSAQVTWIPVAGETYQVNVYQPGTNNKVTTPPQPTGVQTSPYVVNLPKGSYTFSVTATNANGNAESNRVDATVTGVVDTLSVSRAQWKSGDFRVVGTSTALTGTITVHRDSFAGPTITGMTGTLTPAVAPATGTTFDIRTTKAAAPTATPGKIWITSSNGGQLGPITVTG
jgi:hypothetical protein